MSEDPPWGEDAVPPAECWHENQWFDRVICPEPCGGMHYYCQDCGVRIGQCPWASEADAETAEIKRLLNGALDFVAQHTGDGSDPDGEKLRVDIWRFLSEREWLG